MYLIFDIISCSAFFVNLGGRRKALRQTQKKHKTKVILTVSFVNLDKRKEYVYNCVINCGIRMNESPNGGDTDA